MDIHIHHCKKTTTTAETWNCTIETLRKENWNMRPGVRLC